jgi:diaminohydroxyphosphoribosylaminopyrimidine deaminase / 5-amino-6-(5-phosphoribosylamino)uracil reductase
MPMSINEKYMQHCLQLAKKGAGYVSPNPMVGAILVHQNEIIGEGYHQQYGKAHAEVNCINSVTHSNKHLIKDATLFVSLEPCSHHGHTPPCTDFIIQHEIKKVVIACTDYSSKVNGKGIEILKQRNIEVVENILQHGAIDLNRRFFTFQEKKRPYIILKYAQSADGFIGNHSQQIKLTSHETDCIVHQWRAEEDAIWVGANTIKVDNPHLNVRHVKGKNPVRIVYDRALHLNAQYNVLDNVQHTIIFNHHIHTKEGNIEWVNIAKDNIGKQILECLYRKNIMSVLVEGGSKLMTDLATNNFWDELRVITVKQQLNEGIQSPIISNLKKINELLLNDDCIEFFKNTNLRA